MAVASDHTQDDLLTKADLRAGLAETRSEVMHWVAGLIGLQTLAIIGAFVALWKSLH